ncbi:MULTISPECIES: 6-carboxytetrahydropterin synthase [unclassified Mesorhizobium]
MKRLDQVCLNEDQGLEKPTAENITICMWDQTKPVLPLLGQ